MVNFSVLLCSCDVGYVDIMYWEFILEILSAKPIINRSQLRSRFAWVSLEVR